MVDRYSSTGVYYESKKGNNDWVTYEDYTKLEQENHKRGNQLHFCHERIAQLGQQLEEAQVRIEALQGIISTFDVIEKNSPDDKLSIDFNSLMELADKLMVAEEQEKELQRVSEDHAELRAIILRTIEYDLTPVMRRSDIRELYKAVGKEQTVTKSE